MSHSSSDSTPRMTGRAEKRPWERAFWETTDLPRWVRGPVARKTVISAGALPGAASELGVRSSWVDMRVLPFLVASFWGVRVYDLQRRWGGAPRGAAGRGSARLGGRRYLVLTISGGNLAGVGGVRP